MERVFICFAPRDASFAGLLKRLLRFHHFDTYTNGSVEPQGEIDDNWLDPAILQADVFIVVLSKQILGCDWARLELKTLFERGSGRVICLALEDIDPSHFSNSLAPHTVVNFHSNLEVGFEILFSELGAEFLEIGRESAVTDRRRTGERRRSSAAVRLREGFLKAYKRGRPKEVEFSRIPRSVENRNLLYQALREEARRYTYSDRASGFPMEAEQALDQALRFVWEGGMSEEEIAVNLIEDVANAIEQSNRVETLQRRSV